MIKSNYSLKQYLFYHKGNGNTQDLMVLLCKVGSFHELRVMQFELLFSVIFLLMAE